MTFKQQQELAREALTKFFWRLKCRQSDSEHSYRPGSRSDGMDRGEKSPPLIRRVRDLNRSVSESVMGPYRVLFIPELLDNILSFMDRDDNMINARVCKQWSEIALDLVWWEVVSLHKFLNILRPFRKVNGSNVFDRLPDSEDWARFEKYANRVCILRYGDHKGSEDYSCMLDDIARRRPTFEILPNLHTLEWLCQDVRGVQRATLFMHQRVRNLIISAPPLSYEPRSSFFVDIYARMPHLHSLDLRFHYAARLIEADILNLLQGLPDLKMVIFPEFYLTSSIVSELSRMKHINIVKYEIGSKQGCGEEEDVDSFSPILQQEAFPALWDLDITARLGDITRFMNSDLAPIKLISPYINTYVDDKPEKLHKLLVTLSEQCPVLSQLYIKILHVPKQLKLFPARQIIFDTLRPVLSFQKLTTFMVTHKYPVNITLEEIEEHASRWPTLENLSLNEEPLAMYDFTLDLRALVPFARHCPKLRHLGLFMDATTAETHPTTELKPFTALHTLSIGTSLAHDPGTVAAFLSQLCLPGCKLETGITWTGFGGRSCRELNINHRDVLSELQNRSQCWTEIIDFLPIFIQIRKEEREKSKARLAALQEVDELRMKNIKINDR
ncbi:hypothetical protein AZE42_09179 [Rhizopogon vesiculosus]|uniref:F-box domain-containing protein n=1 Tax=Rhizopogon vesiculosus TaxID=180088 RepID=A0A1J8R590_9AGAM|nr:hypothetical protein AZE42_09179 [Rhizopogon vesiculosus]